MTSLTKSWKQSLLKHLLTCVSDQRNKRDFKLTVKSSYLWIRFARTKKFRNASLSNISSRYMIVKPSIRRLILNKQQKIRTKKDIKPRRLLKSAWMPWKKSELITSGISTRVWATLRIYSRKLKWGLFSSKRKNELKVPILTRAFVTKKSLHKLEVRLVTSTSLCIDRSNKWQLLKNYQIQRLPWTLEV